MTSLNPYLVYHGTCEAAFNFYKLVFNAEHLYLGRYKEVPQQARQFFPNAQDEHIMHATLKINEQTVIMGNDHADASTQAATDFVRDFYLYMDMDSPAEAIRVFNELSTGGKIIMPIAENFWSPCYGVLTDKFGINWKITSH